MKFAKYKNLLFVRFMKSFGVTLLALGLGSFVLNYFGYEFKMLSWVDEWGESTGLLIRVACACLGAAILLASHLLSEQPKSEA